MRWFLTAAMLLGGGCDQVFDLTGRLPPDAPDAPGPADAPTDAIDALIDAASEFGPPAVVSLVCPSNYTAGDISLDGNETMFAYSCSAGTEVDLYVAPRVNETTGGAPTVARMTSNTEGSPEFHPDGLQLYYLVFSAPGIGQINLLSRPTTTSAFTSATPAAGLNSGNTTVDDRPGSPDATGTRIVIGRDVKLVELASSGGAWSVVPTTSALNAPGISTYVNPTMTADGLTLVFAAGATAGSDRDLYIAQRAALTDSWSAATPLSEVNTAANETDPWLSPDGRRLYFARNSIVFLARK